MSKHRSELLVTWYPDKLRLLRLRQEELLKVVFYYWHSDIRERKSVWFLLTFPERTGRYKESLMLQGTQTLKLPFTGGRTWGWQRGSGGWREGRGIDTNPCPSLLHWTLHVTLIHFPWILNQHTPQTITNFNTFDFIFSLSQIPTLTQPRSPVAAGFSGVLALPVTVPSQHRVLWF